MKKKPKQFCAKIVKISHIILCLVYAVYTLKKTLSLYIKIVQANSTCFNSLNIHVKTEAWREKYQLSNVEKHCFI